MRYSIVIIVFSLLTSPIVCAQQLSKEDDKQIHLLIDQYAQAREQRDTTLLKSLLTEDIDQLVSSGEWRNGIKVALDGMMRSSESNPGSRKFIIENIRLINSQTGIVDARYEISNADGTKRKMWSSFTIVNQKGKWRITAIRNMLPAGSN
jgi:uncharacterized protein (TIGR02246 family)